MIATPHRAWERFWFSPEPAVNLGVARIVFSVHALWILLSRDLAALADLPAPFWSEVAPGTRWRYLLFPGNPDLERVLQWTAAVMLLTAALGVWPRVSCLLSGLLLYHLAPLETVFWTPAPFERGFTISVLALVTLGCSPCGDSLSVCGSGVRGPSWQYAWPLRLVQLFVSEVYLAAGIAKLARVGTSWASSENLRGWLLIFNQEDQVAVFQSLGPWIAARPLLCGSAAVAALALNLGFVVGLFWRRARPWLAGAAVAFHAGVLLAMNIAFLNVPQLLVFVDWDALGRRFRRAARRAGIPSAP